MRKVRQWDRRKEKKARFKRSLERARRRGEYIYGGWAKFDIDSVEEWIITFRNENDAKNFVVPLLIKSYFREIEKKENEK